MMTNIIKVGKNEERNNLLFFVNETDCYSFSYANKTPDMFNRGEFNEVHYSMEKNYSYAYEDISDQYQHVITNEEENNASG